jgi:hypothetical protein
MFARLGIYQFVRYLNLFMDIGTALFIQLLSEPLFIHLYIRFLSNINVFDLILVTTPRLIGLKKVSLCTSSATFFT